MYNKPLVSIIIPVYNGAKYMRFAIDSALAQTYENTEIIVVNDGSSDATEQIALSYGDRIRYFSKENGGCASALNYGISQMRGEWFSWLSHDDMYAPEKVEKEISWVEKNQLDPLNTIVSCCAILIDNNGDPITHSNKRDSCCLTGDTLVHRLLFGSSLNGCGLLIPKTLLDRVGAFSEDLKYILDWEYWIRAALAGATLYRQGQELLVFNRIHAEQVTVKAADRLSSERLYVANKLCALVLSTASTEVIKDFYIHACLNKYNELQKTYREELERRHAFSPKISIYAHWLSGKKQLRQAIAGLYWKIVRGAK